MSICEICEKTFTTLGALKTHNNKADFCKKIQQKILEYENKLN